MSPRRFAVRVEHKEVLMLGPSKKVPLLLLLPALLSRSWYNQ